MRLPQRVPNSAKSVRRKSQVSQAGAVDVKRSSIALSIAKRRIGLRIRRHAESLLKKLRKNPKKSQSLPAQLNLTLGIFLEMDRS